MDATPRSREDHLKQIREALSQSVELLRSDVPLGASGGIDSGAVVGLMKATEQKFHVQRDVQ